MNNLEEAKNILKKVGMPERQQTDLCGYTFLALAGLKSNDSFKEAKNNWIRIHDIIIFISKNYGITYAENSRETIRKQALHPFRAAALVEDNGVVTNSPNYRYRITKETLTLIKSYNTTSFKEELKHFCDQHESLISLYESKKKMTMMPVKINGQEFHFSSGKHNELQKAIIEEFAPRFAPNAECLYVGDTIAKDLVKKEDILSNLGFEITLHDKMPDVVLYIAQKNWLYFIEAVTSVGPVSPKRILEINELAKNVKAGKIYITAFLDFPTYKKFSEQLAWETEVWIANMPDHMIHLNGDKFMGPRE